MKKAEQKLNNKGFSLVELLVAVAVLAIVVVPLLHSFVISANTASRSRSIGNATIAGENLAEIIESASLSQLIDDPVTGFGADSAGYGFDGASDIKPQLDSKNQQYICLNGVVGGSKKFNARITLDPTTEYSDINDTPLSEYGEMDAVLAQSRNENDDPDAIVKDKFTDEINALYGDDWDSDSYTVKREITVTVSIDTEDANKLVTSVVYYYLYTYTCYTDSVGANGLVTRVPHIQTWDKSEVYTLFPNGYTYNVGGVQKYPNIYFMYYPMYSATEDNITVTNDDNLPFSLFLVKQREPNMTDVQLSGLENNYRSLITQHQSTSTHRDPVASVYSNAKERLGGGLDKLSGVRYVVVYNSYLTKTVSFAGDEVGIGTFVEQSSQNRIYRITIEIFVPEDDYSTDGSIYSFEMTKLQ